MPTSIKLIEFKITIINTKKGGDTETGYKVSIFIVKVESYLQGRA